MQHFKNSLKMRKEYLARICKQHKTWKTRMAGFYFLNIIAIGIVVGICIMLIKHPLDAFGSFIFLAVGVAFGCVPFFISRSVKNTAKYKCAFPYSSFANGNLILHSDNLEFIHWRVGKEEPAAYSSKRAVYREEDSFIYRISLSQISSLKIDKNHICHISGNGVVSQPEWAGTKGVREDVEIKSFSFLLDFEDTSVEETIRNWRKNNGQE